MTGDATFLAGGGELGRLVRELDWSTTPIGELDRWPQSLRTAVSICLQSRFPMVIWWGPELVLLYNDAYTVLVGDKHPSALGGVGPEVFPEIWDVIGPMLEAVLRDGRASYSEDQLLVLERHGFPEECYFTFSYSPITDGSGAIGGIFTAVTETTDRVLRDRRLRAIGELAARSVETTDADQVCRASATVLERYGEDLPFATIHLLDPDDDARARLVATAGVEPGHPAAPEELLLDDDVWPVGEVVAAAVSVLVDDLPSRVGHVPAGPWPAPTERALLQPLVDPARKRPIGVLVTGISPRHAFDDEYRDFLRLVASNIAAAIVDARAAEQEAAHLAALAELNRAKNEFFSSVSHEFRTPLTLLLGATDELSTERSELPPRTQQQLDVVLRNVLRLHRLIDTLLHFARVEAGRMSATFRPVDLGAVTAELASVFRSAVERAGITYTVQVEPLPTPILLDRDRWEDVVLNLLSNALKHTFEGEIVVRVAPTGRGARLTVSDTGVGIPDDELVRIFQRFERIRGAGSRSHEGTGIGLALVKEIVEMHGGTVSVESEVGRGTTFTVDLFAGDAHLPPDQVAEGDAREDPGPRGQAFMSEAATWLADVDRAAAPVAPPDGARVLVVDDNADMRDYIGDILEEHVQVEYAADGQTALERALADPPDLVLTDVMMPGLDGMQLLSALRDDRRTAVVPVVMLSARAGAEAAVEGLERGADDYLVKPFTAREHVARVRANLELVRLRRQLTTLETREELLAGISHDMQTPLAVIVGFAEVLRQHDLDEPLARGASALHTQAAKLRFQVQRFLDYARLEGHGSLTLDVRSLDAREVIDRAIVLGGVGPRVEVTVEQGTSRLLADGERLEQVLVNLLSNAVKFSPADAPIEVHASDAGTGAVEIRVSDRGTGMSSEDADRAFDRFFRAAPTADTSGTGLGLYMSRTIVEALEGTLTVDSELGEGSTFTVRLPAA